MFLETLACIQSVFKFKPNRTERAVKSKPQTGAKFKGTFQHMRIMREEETRLGVHGVSQGMAWHSRPARGVQTRRTRTVASTFNSAAVLHCRATWVVVWCCGVVLWCGGSESFRIGREAMGKQEIERGPGSLRGRLGNSNVWRAASLRGPVIIAGEHDGPDLRPEPL